jgi:hypothetical protein
MNGKGLFYTAGGHFAILDGKIVWFSEFRGFGFLFWLERTAKTHEITRKRVG